MFINQSKNSNNAFFMKLALDQARINIGNTKENPSVGCVIARKNIVIGAGRTSLDGRPHAETNAIDFSKFDLKNSILYVTIEPCTHRGKTSPCVNNIIKKKIKKIYFSINDPDLRTCNNAKKILKKKNIIVNKGIMIDDVNEFYRSYIKFKSGILPFVSYKLAVSKDYFTKNINKRWITNHYSRCRGHLIRAQHDCILTTLKTINHDNSQLTCRIPGLEHKSPTRIILDKNFKISKRSKVLRDLNKIKTIIFYNKINKNKAQFFKRKNIKLVKIALDENNNIDLKQTLLILKRLGFQRILIEAGLTLFESFLYNDLLDDLYLFVSNKKLNKNGKNQLTSNIRSHLNNKRMINKKVNLFGDQLKVYNLRQNV